MYPVLVEIPDAFAMPGGILVLEVVAGIACFLAWLALHLRGRKDWLATTLNMAAFVVGLHVFLSWAIGGDGPITIYSFGVIIILGFFCGSAYLVRQTRPLGLEDKKIFDWAFWMLVSGIIGARVLYAFLNYEHFTENKFEILRIWNGGLVWYGGLVPATLLGLWLLHRKKLPVLHVADIGIAAVLLALGIGRWACLMAGDDYGSRTDSWLGIRFYHPRALVAENLHGVPLWPTQLFMSVNCLWLFWIVDVIRRRARYAGQAFAWAMILYAVTRSVLIEPLRGDFVERNPGYGWHVAAPVEVRKAADSPPLRVEAGAAVTGADGRTGRLLEALDLPAGEADATVRAISDGPAKRERTSPLFGERKPEPPRWEIRAVDGIPAGATLSPGPSRWYGSDLPKPPGYVSTSQWISIFIVAAGALMLLGFRKLGAPGYAEAVAARGT